MRDFCSGAYTVLGLVQNERDLLERATQRDRQQIVKHCNNVHRFETEPRHDRRCLPRESVHHCVSVLVVTEWLYHDWASRAPSPRPANFVHAEWIALHDSSALRGFVDFLRSELDRVGPAAAGLCHDYFRRAVALELAFFDAAYGNLT